MRGVLAMSCHIGELFRGREVWKDHLHFSGDRACGVDSCLCGCLMLFPYFCFMSWIETFHRSTVSGSLVWGYVGLDRYR